MQCGQCLANLSATDLGGGGSGGLGVGGAQQAGLAGSAGTGFAAGFVGNAPRAPGRPGRGLGPVVLVVALFLVLALGALAIARVTLR